MSLTEENNNGLKREREMRIESFLLLQLLLGYGLSSICFLFGFSLQAWHFWVPLVFTVAAAFWYSRRTGFWMIALNGLMFVLTLYTFTYVHIDASICHVPISHFLEDGWNPIRESSVEAVRAHFAERGMPDMRDFSIYHIIAAPKMVQILAAQMQSAFGLFSAGGYALWFTCFALLIVAYRFARIMWNASHRVAIAFAALAASNILLVELSFWGLVDYASYAGVAISALSLGIWMRTKSRMELFLFFAGAVIAVATKMNSLVCVILFLGLGGFVGRKSRDMRIAFLLFLAALALFCIIPYWTSSWYYGSPFYPAHSFRSDVKTIDLTDDFFGNSDANSMGYLARMVMAWVCRPLAIWGCKIWNGLEIFQPIWPDGQALTGGGGPIFCLLLWGGAILSLFFNRNRVTVIAFTFMLAFLLVPVKYIGYLRYVNFSYLMIVLFWFNILLAVPRFMRKIAFFAIFSTAAGLGGYCAVCYVKQINGEALRVENIKRIRESDDYSLSSEVRKGWHYSIKHRLLIGGAALRNDGDREMDISWPFDYVAEGLKSRNESSLLSLIKIFPGPVWVAGTNEKGGDK